MNITYALAIAFSLSAYIAYGQEENKDLTAQNGTLEYLGKSRPLKDLAPRPLTDKEKREAAKRVKPKTVENFYGGRTLPKVNENALPAGADPVRQSSFRRSQHDQVQPLVNKHGMNILHSGGVSVPDPNGTIGRNYYIQMINATLYQVFDKGGNAISAPIPANTLWNEFGVQSGGDPIILFDQEAERWIITEFTPPWGGNTLLIAISETEDPLGSYNAYRMFTPSFPDYPKYSIWKDVFLVTTNEFGFGNTGLSFYAIDRRAMLDGEEEVDMQRFSVPGIPSVPGFYVLSPVNWSGRTAPPADAPPMILRINDDAWGQVQTDRIEYYTIDTIDWENPDNSRVSGPIPLETQPFDSDPCSVFTGGYSCVPQPSGNWIDAIPQVLMHQVHYRNFSDYEAIVTNFLVDASGTNVAGIRWMEMRKYPGGEWEIYQEGTFAPADGHHRFLGAIAMDGAGNIGMAYSVSSENKHPSLAFTGRRVDDPPGEMTIDEYEFSTGTHSSIFDRFGDYSSMQVDPYDERTFWFTGEYMQSAEGWGTGILAFKLKIDTTDLAPLELIAPVDGSSLGTGETVTFSVKNIGLDTVTDFELGYVFESGSVVSESISHTLYPDSSYTHSFQTAVDFGGLGDYDMKIFCSLDGDENRLNDTLYERVTKYPRLDGELESIDGLEGVLCGTSRDIHFVLRNNGTETLVSSIIKVSLNGVPIDTITIARPVLFGQSSIVPLKLEDLTSGSNQIELEILELNGMEDEITGNNSTGQTFQVNTTGLEITLRLVTDLYPEETSWQLSDTLGNVILTSDDYAGRVIDTITEDWCLSQGECYRFIIFDAFGDGLTGQGVEGDYQILDPQGNVLVSLMEANFGFSEANTFCISSECMLNVDVSITPVSDAGAADGAVLVTIEGSSGGLNYSLDDGQNFQDDNFFSSLEAGEYILLVKDTNDCSFRDTIEVLSCNLEIMATVTYESGEGALDGAISVDVSGGFEALLYSINDGQSFQDESEFTGLASGYYNVVVKDGIGCTAKLDSVFVDRSTPVSNPVYGQRVTVKPNPTEGIFEIEAAGLIGGPALPMEVMDMSGKVVRRASLVRLNDIYYGTLSLLNEPDGLYFIRIRHDAVNRMYRVIKQGR